MVIQNLSVLVRTWNDFEQEARYFVQHMQDLDSHCIDKRAFSFRLWDIRKANIPATYINAHFSKIYSLDFSPHRADQVRKIDRFVVKDN